MGRSKTITFQQFWDAYGKAYGEKLDRLRAERAWNRLSARDKEDAYDSIDWYHDKCQQRGISMMYAQGYLNNRRWVDKKESEAAATKTEQSPTPTAAADTLSDMETW
jgi:hypothetical protein